MFSAGHYSSGVPGEWKARDDREGVNIIDVDDSNSSVPKLKKHIGRTKMREAFLREILYVMIHIVSMLCLKSAIHSYLGSSHLKRGYIYFYLVTGYHFFHTEAVN